MAKRIKKEKSQPSKKSGDYIPSINDQIDAEIDFVLGIEAAIRGLDVSEIDSQGGVRELVFVHIERLKAIGARVSRLPVQS